MSALAIAAAVLLTQAPGYVRLRAQSDDPDPHCLWWRSDSLQLRFQQEGSDDVPGTQEFEAARRSLATWQQALGACSGLSLTEGPQEAARVVGYDHENPAQTRNVLLFRRGGRCESTVPQDDPCRDDSLFACANVHDCWPHQADALAVTSSFHDASTGEVLDADIEFNGDRFFFTATLADGPSCSPPNYDDCVHYDLENTLTHELGHFLGLDHSSDGSSTMYRSTDVNETQKRSLDPGSQQFVCDVYPPDQYPRDCVLDRLDPELGRAAVCGAAPALPAWAALLLAMAWLRRRRAR